MVSLPFRKSHNIVLFVVDSRRHELKQHYESPAAVWCAIHLVFMPGNTENLSTDSAIGFEDLVKPVLSVPVIQRNLPQTQAFVASN